MNIHHFASVEVPDSNLIQNMLADLVVGIDKIQNDYTGNESSGDKLESESTAYV
jgi:hypothetical protein